MKISIKPDTYILIWTDVRGQLAIPLADIVEGKVKPPAIPIQCTLVPTFSLILLHHLLRLAIVGDNAELVEAVSAAMEAPGGTPDELRGAVARLQEKAWTI